MALSQNTVWEVRANGAATNGGGFVDGASGTDHSQQDSAHSTRTDIVIDASNDDEITSAADPFASDDVGNIINITSGTGFTPGRYEITAVAAGVATLDRAVGTTSSTGGNGTLGGAMTMTDANFEEVVAGNTIWLKADADHVLPARVDVRTVDGAVNKVVNLCGYNTTRGDNPTGTNRPYVDCGETTYGLSTGDYWYIKNIRFAEGNGSTVLLTGIVCFVSNCYIESDSQFTSAMQVGNYSQAINCEIINSDGAGGAGITLSNFCSILGCYIHDSYSGVEMSGASDCSIINTIFDTCSSRGIYITTATGLDFISNTIYNCGVGINGTYPRRCSFIGNVIDNCTTGISMTQQEPSNFIDYNNYSNNTADTSNVTKGDNATSVDPGFTDAANGDFSPGTNLKGLGIPAGSFPGGLTSNSAYSGAVQPEPPTNNGFFASIS